MSSPTIRACAEADATRDLEERHEALKADHADLREELAALSRDYRSLRNDYFDLEDRLAKRRRFG